MARVPDRADLDELFGESDEEDQVEADLSPPAPEAAPASSPQRSPEPVAMETDESRKIFSDVGEPHAAVEPARSSRATLTISSSSRISANHKAIFFRTPNFVKVQTKRFDADSYDGEEEKAQFEGATAVIRWTSEGDSQLSNARLLKWSDGTMQLVVGDAVFQAKILPVENCYIFESHEALKNGAQNAGDAGEESQEVEGARGICLECIGPINDRITVQPSSLDSDTHARLSMQIAQKFKKETKITVHDYEKLKVDPDKALHLLSKQEEQLMRKQRKLQAQQQEIQTGTRVLAGYRRPAMREDYLNEEDDEERPYESSRRLSRPHRPRRSTDGYESIEETEDEEEEGDEVDDEMRDFIANDDDEEGEGESLGSQDTEDDEEDEEDEEPEADTEEEEEEEDEGGDETEEEEEGGKARKKDKLSKKDKKKKLKEKNKAKKLKKLEGGEGKDKKKLKKKLKSKLKRGKSKGRQEDEADAEEEEADQSEGSEKRPRAHSESAAENEEAVDEEDAPIVARKKQRTLFGLDDEEE